VRVQGYKELYTRKWSFTKELAYQIEGGLQKMFEAKADVNKMKAELAVKNQDLAVSAKEAEGLLKQISESTAIAEKEKQKVAVIVDAVSPGGGLELRLPREGAAGSTNASSLAQCATWAGLTASGCAPGRCAGDEEGRGDCGRQGRRRAGSGGGGAGPQGRHGGAAEHQGRAHQDAQVHEEAAADRDAHLRLRAHPAHAGACALVGCAQPSGRLLPVHALRACPARRG
jgi:hypothetical protein